MLLAALDHPFLERAATRKENQFFRTQILSQRVQVLQRNEVPTQNHKNDSQYRSPRCSIFGYFEPLGYAWCQVCTRLGSPSTIPCRAMQVVLQARAKPRWRTETFNYLKFHFCRFPMIYMYIYICMYMRYIHIHIYVCDMICIHIHVYMYAYMYLCMYMSNERAS